jgi:chromosome segregation ATPase
MENTIMMKISPEKAFLLAFSILTSTLSMPSIAADKKDKSAHRMQQMVQKIQQEKAELQTQMDQEKQVTAGLEAEVKKSAGEASALKSNLSAANRKAGSLATSLLQANAEKSAVDTKLQQTQALLDNTQKSLSDLTLQYQTAQHDLKVNEQERTKLTGNLNQKVKVLEVCETKNSKLYGFGLELVKLYDKPSTYQAILNTEPFTQLKRVELENILQDYNDKIDEQRVSSIQK